MTLPPVVACYIWFHWISSLGTWIMKKMIDIDYPCNHDLCWDSEREVKFNLRSIGILASTPNVLMFQVISSLANPFGIVVFFLKSSCFTRAKRRRVCGSNARFKEKQRLFEHLQKGISKQLLVKKSDVFVRSCAVGLSCLAPSQKRKHPFKNHLM